MKERLRVATAPAPLKVLMLLLRTEAFFTHDTIYTLDRRPASDKIKRFHVQHAQAMRHGLLLFTLLSVWYRLRYSAQNNPFEREIRAQLAHIQVRR